MNESTCPMCGAPVEGTLASSLLGSKVLETGSIILPSGGLVAPGTMFYRYAPPADLTELERAVVEAALLYAVNPDGDGFLTWSTLLKCCEFLAAARKAVTDG